VGLAQSIECGVVTTVRCTPFRPAPIVKGVIHSTSTSTSTKTFWSCSNRVPDQRVAGIASFGGAVEPRTIIDGSM
jgi:hypothetical protein